MRVVAALGGNALLRRGEPATAGNQRRNVDIAVRALAELAAAGHELVVTHGNGPQIGLLALQAAAYTEIDPYPLDVLGAETDGMIGYLLDQGLRNQGADAATLLTQIVVDADDPAFATPSKPIGPMYDEAHATRLARERGWAVAPDGTGWRRVVASPEPREIVELRAIELLLAAGVVVVCAGGGGLPVVEHDGMLRGVEAVIDKDLSTALLAQRLHADALLLLTDVSGIQIGYGTPSARRLEAATPDELRELDLPAGSMGPKAEAAARFAETGGRAAICALDEAADALDGRAGTFVTMNVGAR